jgi:hypothetical protein
MAMVNTRRKNTDAEMRGGDARSNAETLVMRVERSRSIILLTKVANLPSGDE